MKTGAGKRKGSEFERKIAKELDKWWHVPEHTFWRTVNSGGVWEPGDIIAKDKSINFPFIVECKFYKDIDFWAILLNNPHSLILKWWRKLTEDREKTVFIKSGKAFPPVRLLIFKTNNRPIMVVFEEDDFDYFYSEDTKLFAKNRSHIVYYNFTIRLTIMKFSDFTKGFTKSLMI